METNYDLERNGVYIVIFATRPLKALHSEVVTIPQCIEALCAVHRDREIARPSHCRPTSRYSGRPGIKCSAAGGRAQSAHERYRARVLRGRRAAAELNR
jgi:hypothetical protein